MAGMKALFSPFTTVLMEKTASAGSFPPIHPSRARTIVLCFDGVENKLFDNYSNVTKIFRMLDRSDRSKQLVYYQTCVGTYTSMGFSVAPIISRMLMPFDSAIISTINEHVKAGYRYLMDYYKEGDRICIFGFSRGAQTARILCAMIDKVGLLPVGNYRHIKYAWEVFNLRSDVGRDKAAEFKNSFAMNVQIDFVGSLSGSISPREGSIRVFRHALALDEHRAKFKAYTWNFSPSPQTSGSRYPSSTDVEEVWFAGSHADVGGRDPLDDVRHSLSRISLRWMLRQCFLAKLGILFNVAELESLGLDPSSLYPEVVSRPMPISSVDGPLLSADNDDGERNEEQEDLADSFSPIRDDLVIAPSWWLLEIFPVRVAHQNADGTFSKQWVINGGRPRHIQRKASRVKVHRTVQSRMTGMQYKPRVLISNLEWVD